jgi:hypothetical protein
MGFAGEVSEEMNFLPSAYDEDGYPDLIVFVLRACCRFRRSLGFTTCGFGREV